MRTSKTNGVQTTNKTFDIIEELMNNERMGVTDLATELGMSKSIVHNHLKTLENRGYVTSEDGCYSLSLKFLEISGRLKERSKLFMHGREELRELADMTGEVVNLATEEDGLAVYLSQAGGDGAIELNVNFEGYREYMHCSGLGKAMLAHLSEERVYEIIGRHGLPKQTENTLATIDDLFEDLQRIKTRGYAIDNEESVVGLRCVASAIKTKDGHIQGAVSISGPASRLTGDRLSEELPELVSKTTNIIELRTQY